MKFRLLVSASFVAICATAAAHAEGWTASVLGGPSWSPHLSVGGVPNAIDDGFNVGGRVGYDWGDEFSVPNLSTDLDVFYTQSHFSGTLARQSSLSFMGDLIYHVDLGLPVGVYGGAGVGAVRTMVDSNSFSGGGTVFGWQGLGGIDYPFTPESKLFAEYRYLNAHDANVGPFKGVGNTSNNLSVGIKFDL